MSAIDTETLGRRIIAHPLLLLIIAAVMVVGSVVLTGFIATQVRKAAGGGDLLILIGSIAIALASVGGYWLFTRFVERKPFSDFAPGGALKEWGMGAFLGAAAMTLSVGVIAALGGYVVTGTNPVSVLMPVLGMAMMVHIAQT